jgi:hypothetical protein
MFYHPIISQMLAAERRADLERKLRRQPLRNDLESSSRRRRHGRRHPDE